MKQILYKGMIKVLIVIGLAYLMVPTIKQEVTTVESKHEILNTLSEEKVGTSIDSVDGEVEDCYEQLKEDSDTNTPFHYDYLQTSIAKQLPKFMNEVKVPTSNKAFKIEDGELTVNMVNNGTIYGQIVVSILKGSTPSIILYGLVNVVLILTILMSNWYAISGIAITMTYNSLFLKGDKADGETYPDKNDGEAQIHKYICERVKDAFEYVPDRFKLALYLAIASIFIYSVSVSVDYKEHKERVTTIVAGAHMSENFIVTKPEGSRQNASAFLALMKPYFETDTTLTLPENYTEYDNIPLKLTYKNRTYTYVCDVTYNNKTYYKYQNDRGVEKE